MNTSRLGDTIPDGRLQGVSERGKYESITKPYHQEVPTSVAGTTCKNEIGPSSLHEDC